MKTLSQRTGSFFCTCLVPDEAVACQYTSGKICMLIAFAIGHAPDMHAKKPEHQVRALK